MVKEWYLCGKGIVGAQIVELDQPGSQEDFSWWTSKHWADKGGLKRDRLHPRHWEGAAQAKAWRKETALSVRSTKSGFLGGRCGGGWRGTQGLFKWPTLFPLKPMPCKEAACALEACALLRLQNGPNQLLLGESLNQIVYRVGGRCVAATQKITFPLIGSWAIS